MFGASQDPLHELVFERGRRALAGCGRHRVRRRRPRGTGPRRRGDRRGRARRRACRPCWRSTRPTIGARAAERSSCIASVSIPSSRSAPSTARASASCSTRSSSGCRTARAPPRARRRWTRRRDAVRSTAKRHDCRRDVGRHCRPAQRRQVVARQSAAARGADDRLGGAGHDARLGRRHAALASPAIPHRRHRRHSAAGRVHASGRSKQVSVMLARRAIERADVVVLVIDADAGRRPIRTRRSAARRTRPAAA